MRQKQNASNKEAGTVTFIISEPNERALKAITKYMQRTEYLIKPDELITIDGIINDALECAFTARIKELSKKHGFGSSNDFVDIVCACQDGEEVDRCITEAESVEMRKDYDRILSQIPLPDTQKDLPI